MFSHLHVHTEYSLLDGFSHIPLLVQRARELGMDSLAITDHGALYGVIDFYLACKEAGLKPILGCEVYLSSGGQNKRPYHLVLLAKNRDGYNNLIQIVTKAHLEGFHYKPQADKETLKKNSGGLIALSACPQGEVGRLLLFGQREEAARAALEYKDIFGDFYLEVQPHPIPEVQEVNRGLVSLSAELDLPLVATNDVHYVNKEDAPLHDLLLCIQTNTSIYDERRLKMAGDFFYLRSQEEMAGLFAELPQAVANTSRIAEKCDLELEFGSLHLPEVEVPGGRSADDFLAEAAWRGLEQRYGGQPSEKVKARLSYELDVIRQTRFAHYFLVVWDIASFARRAGILFGVRGSAAASLVLYCLNVTELDPVEHRLVFERFLNVERREMPDIDLDFQDDRREEVLSYVTQKYGQDRVAQIITFGTLGAKAAIRDVGRALGLAYGQVDRVARLVPPALGMTLERALKESRELNDIYQQDETIRRLVDSAQKLEGTVRHASTHAAGVVISKEPLTEYIPLQRPAKGSGEAPMTQFTMENIAQLGLLKLDLLGLANLTILSKARELIKARRDVEIHLQHLPLSDAPTFSLLASGETSGVFQLEGVGMRRVIRELRPSTFADIAALVALYRPGPMEHIPTFIRAKQGIEPIRYPDPVLMEVLEETYGVIVYQDQVLLIAQALAGYSLGEADIIRKAMGKKIPEVMRSERERFIARAQERGYSGEVAQAVFDLIEPFAGYAFNKAHSVSYAMLAYQTAYLKANFPAEYMTAFLNTYADRQDKVAAAVTECARLKLKVLPPTINHSRVHFSLEGEGSIRFGLASIKNVGEAAVLPFLTAREEGEFKSVEDLCRRADLRGVGRRALESLVKVGALDCLGDRGALLHNLERIQALSQREQRLKESGQSSLFNLWGETVPLPLAGLELDAVPLTLTQKLAWEKELLGAYLSDDRLSQLPKSLDSAQVTWCGDIDVEMEGQEKEVVGMVLSPRQLSTQEGRAFLSAVLEDISGNIEITVWPKVYQETKELWQEGRILQVKGRVRVRGEAAQLTCSQAAAYAATPEAAAPPSRKRLLLKLSSTGEQTQDSQLVNRLLDVLKDYPGGDEVCLALATNQGMVRVEWPGLSVAYGLEFHHRLASLIGEANITWEEVPLPSSGATS